MEIWFEEEQKVVNLSSSNVVYLIKSPHSSGYQRQVAPEVSLEDLIFVCLFVE